MSAKVLLTVSGTIPPAAAPATPPLKPRTDYVEMAKAFDADLIDYAIARRESGAIGALMEKIGGPNLLLAWACFARRGRYRAIMTDGEQIGLLLAVMLKFLPFGRRPRHLMIVHNRSSHSSNVERFGLAANARGRSKIAVTFH